ncbi:MAG: SHOCT domain-containing protein [Anaerostipes hadrus]
MEEDEILKYSMQIAMLKQLLRKELINEKEYEKIKRN